MRTRAFAKNKIKINIINDLMYGKPFMQNE